MTGTKIYDVVLSYFRGAEGGAAPADPSRVRVPRDAIALQSTGGDLENAVLSASFFLIPKNKTPDRARSGVLHDANCP